MMLQKRGVALHLISYITGSPAFAVTEGKDCALLILLIQVEAERSTVAKGSTVSQQTFSQ